MEAAEKSKNKNEELDLIKQNLETRSKSNLVSRNTQVFLPQGCEQTLDLGQSCLFTGPIACLRNVVNSPNLYVT